MDFEDGRVPEALRAAEQALSQLEQTHDWSWQVLAQLRLAWLHFQLGASAEAERWVGLAMDRLDGREAPALLAKVEVLRSRVLEQQVEDIAAGIPLSNHIAVDRLASGQQKTLKDALRTVAIIPELVRSAMFAN